MARNVATAPRHNLVAYAAEVTIHEGTERQHFQIVRLRGVGMASRIAFRVGGEWGALTSMSPVWSVNEDSADAFMEMVRRFTDAGGRAPVGDGLHFTRGPLAQRVARMREIADMRARVPAGALALFAISGIVRDNEHRTAMLAELDELLTPLADRADGDQQRAELETLRRYVDSVVF